MGYDVIVPAQNSYRGSIRRYRSCDGTEVWDSPHPSRYSIINGLLKRADGLTVLAGWANTGPAFAVDALDGHVLWSGIPVSSISFVGIGVPDMTGDASDDLLVLGPDGWFRLYDGVAGIEQTWFSPIRGTAAAYDSTSDAVDSDGDGVPDDEDDCPDSDLSETIVIDGCDSGVVNQMLGDSGCTMADQIAACAAGVTNHGQFVSCVAQLTNDWRRAGLINGQEKGRIQRCAARADIPSGWRSQSQVGLPRATNPARWLRL
jgi:hypothetical protein